MQIGDQQSRRIGAEAEIGGMAERNDSGVAENEVEREREQNHDQRLAAENHLVRENEKRRNRGDPGQRLGDAIAVAAGKEGDRMRARNGNLVADGRGSRRFTRVHKGPQV